MGLRLVDLRLVDPRLVRLRLLWLRLAQLRLFPQSAQGDVQTIIQATYWPLVTVLLHEGLESF